MRLVRSNSSLFLLILLLVLSFDSTAPGGELLEAPFFKAYVKAVDAYNRGQLAEAESYLTASLDDYPNGLLAWNLLAEVYRRRGKYKEALEAYKQVERLYPKWTDTKRSMAYLYEQTGEPRSAQKLYLELLEKDPGNVELWQGLIDLLLRNNDENEVVSALERAVKKTGSEAFVRTLATLYFNHKEYGKAEPLFLRLVKKESREASDFYCLGVIAHDRGDRNDALNWFHAALDLRPDYFDACYNLGVLLKQSGRYPEALAEFEKCSEIDPESRDVYRQLGQIYEENIMDMDRANAYFEKAGGRRP